MNILPAEKIIPIAKKDILVDVLYSTGIREDELLRIRLQDVDFGRLEILVHGKGGKDRLAIMGPAMAAHLKKYIEEQNLKPGDKLFRISRSTLIRKIKKYFGPEFSPHSLRHAFATHLYEAGADLISIAELLGHESVASTQIYTHPSVNNLKMNYSKAHPRAK